jgi:carboxymethylenebutenolidase
MGVFMIRTVETADGQMKVRVLHPAARSTSGVILYMDAFGPRPALEGMAARMAAMGHVVVLPDLFYRFGVYGPFDPLTAFGNPETRETLMGMLGATTQAMTERDSGALLDLLAEEGATGPIATVGYCMGGARALTAAAAYPDRIRAAASLHGGNLASDQPDSPHLRAGQIKARIYVGCAGVDRSFPPEQSARLAQALREAEVDHLIENYVGCQHGWCVPDHSVYDAAGAARHWQRIETLFVESLTTG